MSEEKNYQPYQPIFILPEGTQRNTGKDAQRMNIEAARLVAEAVRTTLGPKGMDKMLVDSMGDITITNDGVTILKEMNIEHPSAKMIVEIAKTQENEVGDGTTTAVVLAGELLKLSEELLDKKIHPTIIANGFRIAAEEAIRILNEIAEKTSNEKTITKEDEKTLQKAAITAMTGKGAENNKELLSKTVVEAIKSVINNEEKNNKTSLSTNEILNNIKVEQKSGGSVKDSMLIKGVILDKERVHSSMPKKIEKARIALIDSPIEIPSTEADAKISITDPGKMQEFLVMEEELLKKIVDKIISSGANVVFCQKGIDDLAQHFLAKNNIMAVRRVKRSDLEKLSKATGAKIINDIKNLTSNDLGEAGIVEERMISEESMIFVEDCKNPMSVSILIRGGTEHVVDEIKRAVDDALGDVASIIINNKLVAGAASCETELSRRLNQFAEKLSGREQLAVKAFSQALEIIPRTLAENAGLDPIDVLVRLKSAHEKGEKWAGINVFTGEIMNAWEEGIIEPLKIKTQAITSASEVAIMILRIDDIIMSSPSRITQNNGFEE